MATLGFIGLGAMGAPMAGNLLAAGHALKVCDLFPERVQALEAGGAFACTTPAEAARGVEVLFLMVPGAPEVEAVLWGKTGAAEALTPGGFVVDLGTTPPGFTRETAARLAARDVELVDAPVSGRPVGAGEAALTIMAGGTMGAFKAVLPFLQLLGSTVIRIGGPGLGQTAKVANQIMVALHREAAAEALAYARKAGADPERVRLALMGGLAQSRVLERQGRELFESGFDPAYRTAHLRKDLASAVAAAEEVGLELPLTRLARDLYQRPATKGRQSPPRKKENGKAPGGRGPRGG